MSGESSSARAMAIASQVHRLGRPMDLAESAAGFERLSVACINDYIGRELGAAWRSKMTRVTVEPAGS
jgi:hypothetical protein